MCSPGCDMPQKFPSNNVERKELAEFARNLSSCPSKAVLATKTTDEKLPCRRTHEIGLVIRSQAPNYVPNLLGYPTSCTHSFVNRSAWNDNVAIIVSHPA